MAGRWHQFRRHKGVEKRLDREKKEGVRGEIQSRMEGSRDMRSYKQSIQQKKRESMVGRLDHWRNEEREAELERILREKESKVDEARTRAQFSQDDRSHKEEERRREREELERRGEEARDHQEIEGEMRREKMEEERDGVEVRMQMSQNRREAEEEERRERRESLMRRGESWREGKEWEEDQLNEKFWDNQDDLAVRAEFAEDDRFHKEEGEYEAWRDRELQSEINKMAKLHEEGMTSQKGLEEKDGFEVRKDFALDDREERRRRRELRKQSIAGRLDQWRMEKELESVEKQDMAVIQEEDEILKDMDRVAIKEAKRVEEDQEIEDILSSTFAI